MAAGPEAAALAELLSGTGADPAAWVARVLSGSEGSEALEQTASTWILRLQRHSNDLGVRLDEATTEAVGNMPRVLTDIELLQHDALAMRAAMAEAQQTLDAADGPTDAALRTLAELDRVKSRMQACHAALLEAENWTKLSLAIEQSFTAGDWRAVADKLRDMTRSLQVFRSLPEYEDHRALLTRLQNRFHASLSPQVVAALQAHDMTRALELYAVFEQTDRTDEYRHLYVKARRPALLRAWADLPLGGGMPAPGPGRVLARLADAVGDYYETTLLAAVARELAWLTGPFAPNAPAWVAALVAEVLGNLEPPLAARVATALADARATDDELVGVLNVLGHAKGAAARLDRALPGAEGDAALTALFQSYSGWMRDYGALERRLMLAQLNAVPVRRLAVSDTVQNVTASLPRLMAIADAAPDRAVALGASALLPACEDALEAYLEAVWDRLRGVLQYLRKVAQLPDAAGTVPSPAHAPLGPAATPAGAGTATRTAPAEHDWSVCQGAIALLGVCVDAGTAVERLARALDDRAAAVTAPPPGGAARLHEVHLAVARQAVGRTTIAPSAAAALAATATAGTRLARARCGLADLTGRTQAFLLEALLAGVRVPLDAIPSLPQWAGPSQGASSALPGVGEVPLFSLAPSACLTAAGEYLLTLPQQMEPYAAEPALAFSMQTLPPAVAATAAAAGAPDGSDLTELWLKSVGRAATATLVDRILRIPRLAEAGRQQLLTDLRYFRNVLAALDVGETEAFAQLVHAVQDPLAEVQQRLATLPPTEHAVAARLAALRAVG